MTIDFQGMTIEFQAWPKIPRLFRDCTITEKIDGTNSAVGFIPIDQIDRDHPQVSAYVDDLGLCLYAQSRKRIITPEQDNYGFARWAASNAEALARALGKGLHFGEWWGSGIQRGYGLQNGEKRFSLFNVNRYAEVDFSDLPNVGLVPILYQGPFTTDAVNATVDGLRQNGSAAVPGYPRPEGVITFHEAAQQVFKTTLENDEKPKGSKE